MNDLHFLEVLLQLVRDHKLEGEMLAPTTLEVMLKDRIAEIHDAYRHMP